MAAYTGFILLFCVIFSSFIVTKCSIRFICPRPHLPNSTLTQSPCGGGLLRNFDDDYSDLWPGLNTISIESPTIVVDSPMKLYLFNFDKPTEKCLLLDQLPHNNEVRSTYANDCQNEDYPLGACSTPTYLTIRVPDIKCDRCVLQVIQIVPDKGKACVQTEDSFDCKTYYSCANVKIRTSSAGVSKSLATCPPKPVGYPFSEVTIYWKALTHPFEGGFIYFYDRGGLMTYNVTTNKDLPHVSGMGLFDTYILTTGIPYFAKFRKRGLFEWSGSMTNYSTNKFRRDIKRGRVYVRFTYVDKKYLLISFPIEFKESLYKTNTYKPHGLRYDATGMMAHAKVEGMKATFAEVTYPTGTCAALKTSNFGSLLTDNKNITRGMAIFKWTGQKMHLVAIMGKKDYAAWELVFRRPEAISRKRKTIVIPDTAFHENTLQISLPVWDFFLFSGAQPSTIEATDNVQTDGVHLKLNGLLNLTIRADIRNVAGQLRGMAMLTPIEINVLRLVVMIDTYMSRTPPPTELTLNGPASSSSLGPVLMRLLPSLNTDGYERGVWVSDGTYGMDSAELAMMLWNGHVYINSVGVQTRFNFRGQFEPADADLCLVSQHVFCQTCEFTIDGKPKLITGVREYREEHPRGRAAFRYDRDTNNFDISVWLEGMKPGENVTRAVLEATIDMPWIHLDTTTFIKSTSFSNTYTALISPPMGSELALMLKAGLVKLKVRTTRPGAVEEDLTCRIPIIKRPPAIPTTTLRTTTTTTTTTPPTTTTKSTTPGTSTTTTSATPAPTTTTPKPPTPQPPSSTTKLPSNKTTTTTPPDTNVSRITTPSTNRSTTVLSTKASTNRTSPTADTTKTTVSTPVSSDKSSTKTKSPTTKSTTTKSTTKSTTTKSTTKSSIPTKDPGDTRDTRPTRGTAPPVDKTTTARGHAVQVSSLLTVVSVVLVCCCFVRKYV